MTSDRKSFDKVSTNAVCNFDLTEFAHFIAKLVVDKLTKNDSPTKEIRKKSAVSIKASVTPNHIICLECGEGRSVLTRHIKAAHKLTPEQYREEWNLEDSHSMTAGNYSKVRSKLAVKNKLGKINKNTIKKGRKLANPGGVNSRQLVKSNKSSTKSPPRRRKNIP